MVVKSPEDEKRPFTPRPLPVLAPFLNAIYKHKPDLLTAWLISHLVFAGAMSLTPFVQSLRFATVLIAMCGMYVFFYPKHCSPDLPTFSSSMLLVLKFTNFPLSGLGRWLRGLHSLLSVSR